MAVYSTKNGLFPASSHSLGNGYSCMFCYKRLKKWRLLFEHLVENDPGVELFACLSCEKIFLSERGLQMHFSEHHPNRRKDLHIRSFAHILICDQCGTNVSILKRSTDIQKFNYEQFVQHSPRRLYKLTILASTEDIDAIYTEYRNVDSLKLKLSYMVPLDRIPMQCESCGVKIEDISQKALEEHSAKCHSDTCEIYPCTVCGKTFKTFLANRQHYSTVHGTLKQDLLEFLQNYAPRKPERNTRDDDDPDYLRNSEKIECTLCKFRFRREAFNKHDCCTNFVRRILDGDTLVKVPCVKLYDCSVTLNKKSIGVLAYEKLFNSVIVNFQKEITVTLKISKKINLVRLDTALGKDVWNCRFCDAIFHHNHSKLNSLHLKKVHRLGGLWQKDAELERKQILNVYSDMVRVTHQGFYCTRIKCMNKSFCSLDALKWHMINDHRGDFVRNVPALNGPDNNRSNPSVSPELGTQNGHAYPEVPTPATSIEKVPTAASEKPKTSKSDQPSYVTKLQKDSAASTPATSVEKVTAVASEKPKTSKSNQPSNVTKLQKDSAASTPATSIQKVPAAVSEKLKSSKKSNEQSNVTKLQKDSEVSAPATSTQNVPAVLEKSKPSNKTNEPSNTTKLQKDSEVSAPATSTQKVPTTVSEKQKSSNKSNQSTNVTKLQKEVAAPAKKTADVAANEKTSAKSKSAKPADAPTSMLLLHPAPVLGMQAGHYKFLVYHDHDPTVQATAPCGLLVANDDPTLMYFVKGGNINSMSKVAAERNIVFVVGGIPENYKVPSIANLNLPPIAEALKAQKQATALRNNNNSAADIPAGDSGPWECPVCSASSTSISSLQHHLKQEHFYPCFRCGGSFVTTDFQQKHTNGCLTKRIPGSRVSIYFCKTCRQAFGVLRDFYNHVIDNHQTDVTFDEATGQVFPACGIAVEGPNLKPPSSAEFTAAKKAAQSQGSQPVLPATQPSIIPSIIVASRPQQSIQSLPINSVTPAVLNVAGSETSSSSVESQSRVLPVLTAPQNPVPAKTTFAVPGQETPPRPPGSGIVSSSCGSKESPLAPVNAQTIAKLKDTLAVWNNRLSSSAENVRPPIVAAGSSNQSISHSPAKPMEPIQADEERRKRKASDNIIEIPAKTSKVSTESTTSQSTSADNIGKLPEPHGSKETLQQGVKSVIQQTPSVVVPMELGKNQVVQKENIDRRDEEIPLDFSDVNTSVEKPSTQSTEDILGSHMTITTSAAKKSPIDMLSQAISGSGTATITLDETDGDFEVIIDYHKEKDAEPQKKEEKQITIIDDDIQIIPSDDEPIKSTKKERMVHCCEICSRSFKTARVLQEHTRTHLYDAGATCEQTLGVPAGGDVFVCRVCCLAYEQYDVFQQHIKKHGLIFGCSRCTAVSFDQAQVRAHTTSHDEGKLVFGCVVCRIAFRAEHSLLLHMNSKHALTLLWVCQKCSRANTSWYTMCEHLRQMHKHDNLNPQLALVPCASAKLHYQPTNPESYEALFAKQSAQLQKICAPAECPHRTFLSYSETLIGCPVCGSMIPATKYLLENEELRLQGQFKLVLVEEGLEKAIQSLHPIYQKQTFTAQFLTHGTAAGCASQAPAVITSAPQPLQLPQLVSIPQVNYQARPSQQQQGAAPKPAPPPPMPSLIRQLQTAGPAAVRPPQLTTSQARLPFALPQRPPAPIVRQPPPPPPVSVVAAAAKPRATVAPHIAQQQHQGQDQMVAPGLQQHLQIARQSQHVASTSAAASRTVAQTQQVDNTCTVCNAVLPSQAAFKVHSMKHDSKNLLFCLECGFRSRYQAPFYEHLHFEHGNRLLGDVHSICGVCQAQFTTLRQYKEHRHPELFSLVCLICNTMALSSDEAMSHRQRHILHGEFLCTFCAACFKTERALNRHMVKHACDDWVMCRECGMCYRYVNQLIVHFQTCHYTFRRQPNQTGMPTGPVCLPCKTEVFPTPQFHIIDAHMVLAVRMKQQMNLDAAAYRRSLLSSSYLYDRQRCKDIFVCRACSTTLFSNDACRVHASNMHTDASFWTVIAPADTQQIILSQTVCRCGYCNYSGAFAAMLSHLAAKHSSGNDGLHMCVLCTDVFNDPFDLAYHCQYSHGQAPPQHLQQRAAVGSGTPGAAAIVDAMTAVGGAVAAFTNARNRSTLPTALETYTGLYRFPSFSPLYCLLCGACVTDSAFANHIAQHRLPESASGYTSLTLCTFCGVCFVGGDDARLASHISQHAASDHHSNMLGVGLKLMAIGQTHVSGVGGDSSDAGGGSRNAPVASCAEPPWCFLCNEVLSWNAPSVVGHFWRSHWNTPTLLGYHRRHAQRVLNQQLLCRMCNYMAALPAPSAPGADPPASANS